MAAVSWCYDCGEALCERCTTYHQRMKVLMDHSILSLDEIRNRSPKAAETEELCQTHAGKIVEAFCYDHDQLCCLDCVTYDHRGCRKVKSLEETARSIKDGDTLRAVTGQLEWVEEHAKTVIKSRTNTISELDEKQDAIMSDVASLRDEIEQLLRQMEEKLKTELSKMHTALVEELKLQRQDFENMYKAADNGKKVLVVSKALGSDTELCVTAHNLRKRCEEHESSIKSESSNVYNYNYELVVNDVINEFTQNVRSVGRINILRSPSNILPAYMKDMRIEKLMDMNGRSPSDATHCWFTGGKFISRDHLVLADYRNQKLKCFNGSGVMISELGLQGKPWDLCVMKNGEVGVTMPDEACLCLVSISTEGEITLTGDTIESQTGCHGVHLHDDKLFIACSNEIRVLDTSGTLVTVYPLGDRGTRYVMAKNDTVIFTDKTGMNSRRLSENHEIGTNSSRSESRNHRFLYKDAEVRSPRGFTIDGEGNFYVCGMDSNNIHQLSGDGSLNQILLTSKDGIRNPYAIGFEPGSTKMFVTQMDCDVVLMYRLVTKW